MADATYCLACGVLFVYSDTMSYKVPQRCPKCRKENKPIKQKTIINGKIVEV